MPFAVRAEPRSLSFFIFVQCGNEKNMIIQIFKIRRVSKNSKSFNFKVIQLRFDFWAELREIRMLWPAPGGGELGSPSTHMPVSVASGELCERMLFYSNV